MAASHSSLKQHLKPSLFFATALLTLLAVNIIGVEVLFEKNLRAGLDRIHAVQDEHLETYLADAEYLEASDLAKTLEQNRKVATESSSGNYDAGPVLNKMLYWNPRGSFGRTEPLVTPKAREFIMRYDDEWIKGRTYVERGSVKADVSFFQHLDGFKYWDIEKNSPIEELVSQGSFILPAKLPLPETLDLLTAVKVRLIQGTFDGNPLLALQQVRQFAVLLLSTENAQLVMTGLASLELERRAYREYVDREWLDEAAWLPLDRNATLRANRALNATAGYLRALTHEDTFRRVFDNGKTPLGLCAAANEQLSVEYAYRDQLTGWWPFERGYRAGFRRLDQVLESAKQHCRLKLLRKLHDEDAFAGIRPEAPWPLGYLPYFRTLFALRDWTAWPLHFDTYARR